MTQKPGSSQNVVDSQHLILFRCYAGRSASTPPEVVKVDYSAGCYPGRKEKQIFTFTRTVRIKTSHEQTSRSRSIPILPPFNSCSAPVQFSQFSKPVYVHGKLFLTCTVYTCG